MMERLDGPLADLISTEKKEMEAMPKAPDAAWAGIAAAWTPVPPPTPPAGLAETAATSGKAAALKLVAALVVGASAAAGAWVATKPGPPPIERVAAPADAVVIETPSLVPPPPVPETAPPPPAPPVRETPARKVVVQAAPAPAPTLGLAEELALIDAMRKDVAAGRYAEALDRAKEHRDSFVKGSLVADRMDLEAAARCGRGDLEAGRTLADTKTKRWPRAPISQRLRTLCRLDSR